MQCPSSVHVITGLWKHTGGPAESVPALCSALAHHGSRTTLATLAGDMAPTVQQAQANGVHVRLFSPTIKHSLWYSRSFSAASPELASAHDVVHVHGLWQFVDWKACAAALDLQRPLVISPRGSLMGTRLRRSRWKKLLAGLLFDRRNIQRATLLHATSSQEAEEIRRYGYRGPIAVIPNGISIPDLAAGDSPSLADSRLLARWPHLRNKRLMLFLSRIQPIKGLPTLVEAWATLASSFPDWHLVVAGPDEAGHTLEVEALVRRRGLDDRVTFTGALYGLDRDDALLACDFLVLPTTSENFGMVVAEALARARPVLTTHGAPWEGLATRGCGWWIPVGLDALVSSLPVVLSTPQVEMRLMGGRGRQWVSGTFSWTAAAQSLLCCYHWLVGEGVRTPDCVLFHRDELSHTVRR